MSNSTFNPLVTSFAKKLCRIALDLNTVFEVDNRHTTIVLRKCSTLFCGQIEYKRHIYTVNTNGLAVTIEHIDICRKN